jgi:rhamnosyltransferase
VFERFPFVDDIIMSEDQEWARRVLLSGYRVVYEPRAAVRHSHSYTLRSAFRRFFDSGASAERAYLAGGRSAGRALRRAALSYARGELAWLWSSGQRKWIPYAILYELLKFVALHLGARHRRLPVTLKKRCSALPSYWESNPGSP